MKGLVLEGGGAKGAFHCGAVKALYDNGYNFDGVAGTSIGAINGALIVQDCGYESLYNMWTTITAADITHLDNNEVSHLFNREFSRETVAYWVKQFLKMVSNLGVPTDKINIYLHKILDEDKIRKSCMDFGIVTYCLSNREPMELFKEEIPEGELHNFILASAYFPAFKLNRMNGKYYIDGGVYDNLPLNALPEKKGYDEIFAIRTMSRMPYRELKNNDVTVHYICPSEDLGGTIDIKHQSLNYKIKLGYYDALRFIKGYRGNKFYFEGDISCFENFFKTIDEDTQKKLCNFLKIKYENYEKEIAFKLFTEILDIPVKSENAYLLFFEEAASFLNLEKFRIYNPLTFLEEIYNKYVSMDTETIKLKTKKFGNKARKNYFYEIIIPKIREVLPNGR